MGNKIKVGGVEMEDRRKGGLFDSESTRCCKALTDLFKKFTESTNIYIKDAEAFEKELRGFAVDWNNFFVKLDLEQQRQGTVVDEILRRVKLASDKIPTVLKIQFLEENMVDRKGAPGDPGSVQEGLLIGVESFEMNAEGDTVPASDPTKLVYSFADPVNDPLIASIVTPDNDPVQPSLIPVGKARIKGLKVGNVNVILTDNAPATPLVSDPAPCAITLDPVANVLKANFTA